MRSIKNILLGLAGAASIISATATFAQHAPTTFKVGETSFTRPTSWEWVEPASALRKAQIKVKDASGKETADIVFFQFGGSSGGAQANVDRWLGQFDEPVEKLNAKSESVTVGKTKITYVTAEGTYKSGMPGAPATPMANYGLIGAVVEPADGNFIFIRFTGPKALAKSSIADFKKMVQSGLKK